MHHNKGKDEESTFWDMPQRAPVWCQGAQKPDWKMASEPRTERACTRALGCDGSAHYSARVFRPFRPRTDRGCPREGPVK